MKGDCPTAALLQHQSLSVGPLRRERPRSVRPQCQETTSLQTPTAVRPVLLWPNDRWVVCRRYSPPPSIILGADAAIRGGTGV